jgi:predicted RNA-binding protein with PUA-like domain
MPTFLFKTEPDSYSFADLEREKRTAWTGVSNPAALNALRSARKGDQAFIYHTGDEKAVVGLAEILSDPYEDPDRPGATADGRVKFPIVDIKPVRAAKTPLTLAAMKQDASFAGFELVRLPRLSVMTVPGPLDKLIRKHTGIGA